MNDNRCADRTYEILFDECLVYICRDIVIVDGTAHDMDLHNLIYDIGGTCLPFGDICR